jgi:hypothetical protein
LTTVSTGAGQKVPTLLDLSGQNNHLTQTTTVFRPDLEVSGLNGQPVVSFDGVNDALISNASIILDNVHSVFMVFATNYNLGGTRSLFAAGLTSGDGFNYRVNSAGLSVVADSIVTIPAGSGLDNRYEVLSSSYDGTILKAYRDSNIMINQAQTFNPLPSGGFAVGVRLGTSENAQCKVAELIIYNRVLTEDERYNITRYLQEKYTLGLLLGGEFNDSISGWSPYVNGGSGILPTISQVGNELEIDLVDTYANAGIETSQVFDFLAGGTYQVCWTARGAGSVMNIYISHSSNPSSGAIYNLTANKQDFMFTFTTPTAGSGRVYMRTSTPASTCPSIWLSNISLRKIN